MLNVVCGDRSTGAALAAHPIPAMVAITGIDRGRAGGGRRDRATNVARAHLELGGNAPVVVFDDADVAAAAEAIAIAGFFNAGQDCTAATRVLASRAIADELAAALAEQAQAVRFSPRRGARLRRPLHPADQQRRPAGQGQPAWSTGCRRTRGCSPAARAADGAGYFYTPTVVAGVAAGRRDRPATRSSGRSSPCRRSPTRREALELANDTPYGLASSVWTTDHSRALRMSRALDFGCVWINTHIPLVAEMPHGGFKESGYGKDLSAYSLEDYTRVKHVMSAVGDA